MELFEKDYLILPLSKEDVDFYVFKIELTMEKIKQWEREIKEEYKNTFSDKYRFMNEKEYYEELKKLAFIQSKFKQFTIMSYQIKYAAKNIKETHEFITVNSMGFIYSAQKSLDEFEKIFYSKYEEIEIEEIEIDENENKKKEKCRKKIKK